MPFIKTRVFSPSSFRQHHKFSLNRASDFYSVPLFSIFCNMYCTIRSSGGSCQLCAAQHPEQNVLCFTCGNTCRKRPLDKVKNLILDSLTGCLSKIGYSILVCYETVQNLEFCFPPLLYFFLSSPQLGPYIAVTYPCKLKTQ